MFKTNANFLGFGTDANLSNGLKGFSNLHTNSLASFNDREEEEMKKLLEEKPLQYIPISNIGRTSRMVQE